jgi:hypothetical protein
MLSRAEQTLALLNGMARLERAEHRPVWLGEYVYNEEWQRFCTGKPQVAGPLGGSFEFSPTGYHSSDAPIAKDSKYKRRRRMVGDPALAEILPAFADEITWPRIRIAVEKLGAVISGRSDKSAWVNVLERDKYATRDAIERLKENIEDPRHHGLDAAHGVSKGSPLKRSRMTEKEGFDFVTHVFNTYVDRHP